MMFSGTRIIYGNNKIVHCTKKKKKPGALHLNLYIFSVIGAIYNYPHYIWYNLSMSYITTTA